MKSKDKNEKRSTRGKDKAVSPAMLEASNHVKDFMTDNQKALTYMKVGKMLMDKDGNFLGAIEVLSEGISCNPGASLFTTRATAHKSVNKWSEAYFDYCYAIRLEPESHSFYCSRGLCLAKLKRYTLSIEDLDSAINIDPLPYYYYTKGTIMADNDYNDQACDSFSLALDCEVITSDIKLKCLYRRASSCVELENYEQAVKDLSLLIQNDPNGVGPRALLSRSLKLMNDLYKAEEQISHAIVLDEKTFTHYIERGDIRFRTNDKFKIIESVYDFDKAIEILSSTVERVSVELQMYAEEEKNYNAKVAEVENNDERGGAEEKKTQQDSNKNSSSERRASQSQKSQGQAGAIRPRNGNATKGGGQADDVSENVSIGEDSASGKGSKAGSMSLLEEGEDEEGEEEDEDFDAAFGDDEEEVERKKLLRKEVELKKKAGKRVARVDKEHLRELERQLGDTHFRRSQCRIMLAGMGQSNNDISLIYQALEDAKSATNFVPSDDDFHLAVATCNIKLKNFHDAMESFRIVLARNPRNQKALYQFSFCQRAVGQNRDAIEGLTKIIATAQRASQNALSTGHPDPTFKMAVPLERVYETRGTLFHEIQAHKLALSDLGRAIALNESRAQNYYLRGDCLSKLGNYEMALNDYNLAQEKGFADVISLASARGMVHRLLGDSVRAREDFEFALEELLENSRKSRRANAAATKENNNYGTALSNEAQSATENYGKGAVGKDRMDKDDAALLQVRLCSLRALCFLDVGMYNAGHDILVNTIELVNEMEDSLQQGKTLVDAILEIEKRIQEEEDLLEKERLAELARIEEESKELTMSEQASLAASRENSKADDEDNKMGEGASIEGSVETEGQGQDIEKDIVLESDNDGFERTDLDFDYKNNAYNETEEEYRPPIIVDKETLSSLRRLKWVLLYHAGQALHMQKRFEDAEATLVQCTSSNMLACAPDDLTLGMVQFFLGVQRSLLERLEDAEEALLDSEKSKWGKVDKNATLINFSKAKLYQQQKRHDMALAAFDRSIETDPNNAHAFFRRAWSHKAKGDVKSAGADFEMAKQLRFNDPNFSVDYKRINQYEYMTLESEPDLSFVFPSLLPRPGLVLSSNSQTRVNTY